MSTETGSTAESGPIAQAKDLLMPLTREIRQQVSDARLLLEHAIESGFKATDGTIIPTFIVSTIKATAAMVGEVVTTAEPQPNAIPSQSAAILVSEWTRFEIAYYQLAILLYPITAKTLRDTEETGHWWILEISPAIRFTRALWLITLIFAAFVMAGEWGTVRYGPINEGIVDWPNTLMQISQVITPYAYGGLGACLYLLRSAHQYIFQRTFDVHRKPEYFNRILLGSIGGGAIILFIDQDVQQGIRLSAAALGFLAGYSTDFLFSAIERVVSALLPKVALETVRRAAPPVPALQRLLPVDLSLKDLLERYERAQEGQDKELYKTLIEQFFRVQRP
jgi:uncharacterized membrane protein YhaH (DUF805 family)